MNRVSEQILFLMGLGKQLLPEMGELTANPAGYSAWLPLQRRAVTRGLNRLAKKGWIRKIRIRGNESVSWRNELTNKGVERIREIWPQWTKNWKLKIENWKLPPWDGRWRVVVFDIPEKYRGLRAILRRFLTSMGFAGWQKSLWLTPFDVGEEVGAFLQASKLSGMAMLLEVNKIAGMDDSDLAGKVWGLDKWRERYAELAKGCRQAEKLTGELKQKFAKLIFGEPWLPEELLPKDYGREKAVQAYFKLLKGNLKISNF